MTTMLSEARQHHLPGIFSDAHRQSLSERFAPQMSLGPAGGERMFGGILKGLEIVGVAGAMSYFNARHAAAGRNAYEVMGVPADLALGLLFSGFALTGYFGQQGDHALNFGIGFLGAYACRMGSIWGAAARPSVGPSHATPTLPAPSPYAAPPPAAEKQPYYPWAA